MDAVERADVVAAKMSDVDRARDGLAELADRRHRMRTPRTALPLLGPWAPALPSGGWVLHLPGGRSRFAWTDDLGPPGSRRVKFGGGLATCEGAAAVSSARSTP